MIGSRFSTENTTRLAGDVTSSTYLRFRQDEAVALLEQRTGQDRALYGIDTA